MLLKDIRWSATEFKNTVASEFATTSGKTFVIYKSDDEWLHIYDRPRGMGGNCVIHTRDLLELQCKLVELTEGGNDEQSLP